MSGHFLPRAAAAALALALAGCAPAAIVGLGVGAGVAQERSTRDQMTDFEIGLSIQNALASESGALFQAVDLEVVEGRVLLAGAVPRPEDRIRAVEIAWATPSVVEVINELEVAGSGGISGYANDAWISTQVRSRLLGTPGVNPLNFNVDTVNGVVHLLGLARSQQELQRAARAAAAVPGARQVVSHVLLIDDPRRKAPAARPSGATPPAPASAG
ncbi:MAG: BON domain-containing protein [Rubrimonas sp.]|uniref:BON domain-containing protein n=1 Tax=Rubrimonas sp. TaxID=2036015 RepID=UPI002FDEC549